MCGIYSIFNIPIEYKKKVYNDLYPLFIKGRGRGPEYSTFKFYSIKNNTYILGFHRLAINGLNDESNQPFEMDNIQLICNGEIYNYKKLIEEHNLNVRSDSDCEVILHLYKMYGIERTLKELDGVFSFVLIDSMTNNKKMYVARDRFGIRPLYQWSIKMVENDDIYIGFSSEMKTICSIGHNIVSMKQFKPATYSYFTTNERDIWESVEENKKYYNIDDNLKEYRDEKVIYNKIYTSLYNAVRKRVLTTDRPIACLLSGGLDSSLITSLVKKVMDETKKQNILETYSIGLKGSEDLKYARKVATYLKTKHTEVIVSEEDFLKSIPKVIYNIESYDTTTIRASVGNYLISEYISIHSDAKVIFNGDGSDEVCGGYLYFHMSPNELSFHDECKRLLENIHYFDVLRSDKSISSNGLEPRTPFLDAEFVETYLSISSALRYNTTKKHCEKYLLRNAFSDKKLLPNDVLWRTKEAFSDGVSSHSKSWYQIIQEYVEKNIDKINMSLIDSKKCKTMIPKTIEQYYYFNIYSQFYKHCENVIPEYWMPRFVENMNDASARTLSIYKDKIKNTNIMI